MSEARARDGGGRRQVSAEAASGAYDAFKSGDPEQRRRLMNLVFSSLELRRLTPCYVSPLEKTVL